MLGLTFANQPFMLRGLNDFLVSFSVISAAFYRGIVSPESPALIFDNNTYICLTLNMRQMR